MEQHHFPLISGVDIVGCDVGDGGRSCTTHEICGTELKVDDVIVFRAEVVAVEGEGLEHVVKAHVVRLGAQLCHVGFLPRRLLRMKDAYANRMAIVVEDLRKSDNSQKRR
ncbi:hypothetical protein PR003_g24591, partial [Phytophthora rubi]